MSRAALAGLGGLTMALGLAVAGLTDPLRIIGFLDFAGAWDATALFVMAGAAGAFGVGFRGWSRLVGRRGGRPIVTPRFTIDSRLVVGALLFGVGWGMSGLCPGPALVVLAGGSAPVVTFVAFMLAGIALHAARARLARGSRSAVSAPAGEG